MRCDEIRALDRIAIERIGVPGLVLMENAGRSVAEFVWRLLANPGAQRVVVLCGPGNNGGDGFVAARHLRNAGVPVTLVLAIAPDRYRGDAEANLRTCERLGHTPTDATQPDGLRQARDAVRAAHVVVDALLGTGARGAPRGVVADLIRVANEASATRVAIDLPSGLDGDSGVAGDPCFRADATIALVAPKAGFDAPSAKPVLGRVIVAGIGVPRDLMSVD